jgi:hypothetical protein
MELVNYSYDLIASVLYVHEFVYLYIGFTLQIYADKMLSVHFLHYILNVNYTSICFVH